MKIKVTMKDPDTLGDALDEAVRQDVAKIPGLAGEEREALFETRREATAKICAKWFRYSEYVTVEIDTEARTAIVCEAS